MATDSVKRVDEGADSGIVTQRVPANRHASTPYVYALAFFSGMCIMAVELSASRLVAPFFGASTVVWTNIIGVIMVALSVGYFAGGKLADRRPQISILLKLLLLASVFLLVIPFVTPPLTGTIVSAMKGFNSSFSYIFFGSMVTITLLFFFPVVVMGMTSPFLIRIIAREGHVGVSAGRIFGISTIGSIIGTFLPVLFFIPTFGTGKTILFFAACQFVISIVGFPVRKYSFLSVAMIVPFLFPVPLTRKMPGDVYSTESAYEYIQVRDHGHYRYLIYDDGVGPQSAIRKGSVLTGLYFDFFSLLPYLSKNASGNALLIGLGGGTIADQLHYFHPAVRITAVEIDPKTIQIARKYFHLTTAVKVYNMDGRIFESRNVKEKFDTVIIDAYTRQLYVPFYMTTVEFFSQVKKTLAAGGIVAMNIDAVDGNSKLLNSITNTLNVVFGNVYRMRVPGTFNYIVLASTGSIDFSSLVSTVGTRLQRMGAYLLGSIREVPYDKRYPTLTDDKAPVERMVDWALIKRG